MVRPRLLSKSSPAYVVLALALGALLSSQAGGSSIGYGLADQGVGAAWQNDDSGPMVMLERLVIDMAASGLVDMQALDEIQEFVRAPSRQAIGEIKELLFLQIAASHRAAEVGELNVREEFEHSQSGRLLKSSFRVADVGLAARQNVTMDVVTAMTTAGFGMATPLDIGADFGKIEPQGGPCEIGCGAAAAACFFGCGYLFELCLAAAFLVAWVCVLLLAVCFLLCAIGYEICMSFCVPSPIAPCYESCRAGYNACRAECGQGEQICFGVGPTEECIHIWKYCYDGCERGLQACEAACRGGGGGGGGPSDPPGGGGDPPPADFGFPDVWGLNPTESDSARSCAWNGTDRVAPFFRVVSHAVWDPAELLGLAVNVPATGEMSG